MPTVLSARQQQRIDQLQKELQALRAQVRISVPAEPRNSKSAYPDGNTHIVLSPLEFVQRLAALYGKAVRAYIYSGPSALEG